MHEPSDQPSPERDAFDALAFQTLAELAQIHLELHPGHEMSHFTDIYKILYENPLVSGDKAIAQLERAQNEGKQGEYFTTALVVSSAYLAEAHREAEGDRIGRAWYALARACYWCGVMRSVNEKLDFTAEAAEALRKAVSGLGGKKRAANYTEAKKQVIQLANEFRPAGGWSSRREAVLEIKSHLEDLIPENPVRQALADLSHDRWERTFSDWLAEELTVEQFSHLFPHSRLPKALLEKEDERQNG
jgi:hypothetical protein